MADGLRMALMNLLRKVEMARDVDFLQDGVRILGQAPMGIEVSQHVGAEKNERTRSGRDSGTGIAPAGGTRRGEAWNFGFRGFGTGPFSKHVRAAPACRAGSGGRHSRSLPSGRFHPAGRRTREGTRDGGDPKEPGIAPV